VKLGRIGARIAYPDPYADILRRGFGVVRRDLPIAILLEDASVDELEFGLFLAAPGVLLPKQRVGKFGVRVVVAPAQPRGGRCRVAVPPILLDILAMISLRPADGSRPFQNVSAKQRRCDRSLKPARPSSFHR
jgi:hypothetical protein